MAAIKTYTDLEQSKILAKYLPTESADGHYWKLDWKTYRLSVGHSKEWQEGYEAKKMEYIPCWSLTALLELMPKQFGRYTKSLYWFDNAWCCEYIDEDSEGLYGTSAENPIDACYEMICKLHEQGLLQLNGE